MQTWEEDEASATDRIIDLNTGETVGLLYRWEDGEEQPLWFNGAREGVAYSDLNSRCTGPDAEEQ